MSLVFAGIVPSTPLLIEALRPKEDTTLSPIVNAIQAFEQELYLTKPDVCFIITEAAATIKDTCTLHAHPTAKASLIHFGDFSKETTWQGTPDIAAQLLHASYEAHVPCKLESNELLDDESTVVLELIGQHLPYIKLLPIGSSIHEIDTNVAIGRMLREWIAGSNKRIAILVAGTLSATHTESTLFNPIAESDTFDADVRNMLNRCDAEAIQSITYHTADSYHMSLYTPLLILSGICQEMTSSYSELGYAVSHGIGYTIGTLSVT